MKNDDRKRPRMMFDLPLHIKVAIKLLAIKRGVHTGDIVAEAIEKTYAEEVEKAKAVVAGWTQEQLAGENDNDV